MSRRELECDAYRADDLTAFWRLRRSNHDGAPSSDPPSATGKSLRSGVIPCGSKVQIDTMNAESDANHPKVIPHVILTGTAKEGCVGPPIGLVDIGVSEAAYIFRVCLPGVEKHPKKIKCEIQREGRVCIRGVVPEVAIPDDSGSVYRMQVQQFCPPGPFSVSFTLPGQVDPRLFSPRFRPDGILEVVVVKLGGQIPAS